jgi:hypothetical protein
MITRTVKITILHFAYCFSVTTEPMQATGQAKFSFILQKF